MPLATAQMQVGSLVMGPGTAYTLDPSVNPFTFSARADQGGPRAWNHGTWSGAEWANERVVPIRLMLESATKAGWLAAFQQLAAVFAPVGDSGQQVQLRFEFAGSEYLLFGRPRLVDPDTGLLGSSSSLVRASFVAQDPRIYSGTESVSQTGLPTQTGGLAVPFTAPFTVNSTLVGGSLELTNAGTAAAGLLLRIDGPVPQPRIVLQRPDGTIQEIRFLPGFDLPTGQHIAIDTAARTALLNGLPQASVRGQASWDVDPFPLLAGVTTLRFGAADVADGTLTARFRSAWW